MYDAINVLMALGIIGKDKKEITWKGFPELQCTAMDKLRAERARHVAEVERMMAYLQVRWGLRKRHRQQPAPAASAAHSAGSGTSATP